jgi:hypothetical protein
VLFERFAEVADEVMLARGWTVAPGQHLVGAAFIRPVSAGFVATAELSAGRGPIFGRIPEHAEPPLHASARVGVSCLAVDRLLRAAWGERWFTPATSADVGELLVSPREVEMTITAGDQVRPTVEALAELIDKVAMPFATPLANFEALLAELQPADDGQAAWGYVPALLAAFGHNDEARDALARYIPYAQTPEDPTFGAGYRSFARQLTRVLDGEVTVEELEAAIPPEPELPVREAFSWRGAWDQVHSERAAVDAVRTSGAGVTRDRRRELLRAELDRRQLRKSPTWIEAKLDQLEPGHQPPSTLDGILALGKFAVGLTKAIKNVKTQPDAPAWLAPPERARYEIITFSRDRVAVELDDDAHDWLDRVHDAAPSVLNTATITVWLDNDSETPPDSPRLIASIGARRVGRLTPSASAAFADSMAAAASRNELPCTRATLTRRTSDPRYILKIAAPSDAAPKR